MVVSEHFFIEYFLLFILCPFSPSVDFLFLCVFLFSSCYPLKGHSGELCGELDVTRHQLGREKGLTANYTHEEEMTSYSYADTQGTETSKGHTSTSERTQNNTGQQALRDNGREERWRG